MNKVTNTSLLSGEFDDDGEDEFILPTKNPVAPLQEDPPEPPPRSITTPQHALDRSTSVPPQLVEDVMENVELLRPVARSMAALNLHNLFVKIQHPATTTKDRLEFQTLLNKMGGLTEVKGEAAQQVGPGFNITINIPQMGEVKGNVIEAKATPLVDAGDDE